MFKLMGKEINAILGAQTILIWTYGQITMTAVILLPAHHASFEHNFVSRLQSFYFSESQDAIVLQTCH